MTLLTTSLSLARRNLLSMLRLPQALVFLLVQPILFVLMFRYVFGGAIHPPGVSYVNYLLPGIFTQTVVFAGISTAIALSEDTRTGFLDRMKSLPIPRSSFLFARLLADTLRSLVSILVMLLVGLAVGFRPSTTPLRFLLALLLLTATTITFLFLFSWIGLRVATPEAAQAASFPLLFPLVFVSGIFVPVASMPGWLRGFATHQPVSLVATCLRSLFLGGPYLSTLLQALAWLLGLSLFFAFLAIRRYQTS